MAKRRSKNIVFYTTGSNKNFLENLSSKDRKFDLFVINYEPEKISYKGGCYEYLVEERDINFQQYIKRSKILI